MAKKQDDKAADAAASVDQAPAPLDGGAAIPPPEIKGHRVRMIAPLTVAAFRHEDGTLYEVADGMADVGVEHVDTALGLGFSTAGE